MFPLCPVRQNFSYWGEGNVHRKELLVHWVCKDNPIVTQVLSTFTRINKQSSLNLLLNRPTTTVDGSSPIAPARHDVSDPIQKVSTSAQKGSGAENRKVGTTHASASNDKCAGCGDELKEGQALVIFLPLFQIHPELKFFHLQNENVLDGFGQTVSRLVF